MKQRGLRSLLSKPETISKPKETEAKTMVTIRIAICGRRSILIA